MKNALYLMVVFAFLIGSSLTFSQEKSAPTEEKKSAMEMGGIKELDAFHELLHPLVHDAYPQKDFAAIKEALPNLIESATTLKSAKLPQSMSGKKKAFRTESKKLVTQLTQLNKKKDTLGDEEFGKRFMNMHDTFEKLMEMTK